MDPNADRTGGGLASPGTVPGSVPLPPQDPAAAIPPAPIISDTPPPTNVTTLTSMQGPAIAADDDLIEKEWVDHAQQIVLQTAQDPYQQNKQLAALKAEYMQKRYNKTIKLSE